MADVNDLIAQGTGGNSLQQLGSIMNLGLQKQQLQNSQLANQKGQIELQNAQATQKADQARGMAASEVTQQDAQQERLKTLQGHVANGIGQLLMLHGKNASSEQMGQIVINTMKNAGAPEQAIAQALTSIPSQAALDAKPGLADQFIVQKAASSIGGMAQLNKVAPDQTPINTGGQVQMANTGNPQATGQVQPPLQNTLPPSGITQLGQSSNGQPTATQFNPNGTVQGMSGVPVNGRAQEPFVMPSNENPTSLKYAQDLRQSASTIAATVPQTQAFANNAIKCANGATTGVGADLINNLKGQYAGTPWTSPGSTDYNLMGHALSQMTGSLAQSAGLSTNQGQSLAANQVGDKSWTKDSIQTAAREVRALSTGASLFNQGMNNYTNAVMQSQGSSAGQFAPKYFQDAWSKVADVNALKLYDAVKNSSSDPQAVASISKTLGAPTPQNPKGSLLYQQTLKKIDAMQTLLKGGQ